MGSTMIMVLSAVILISLTWREMESEASAITSEQDRDDNNIITDGRRNINGRFSLKQKRGKYKGKGKSGSGKSASSGKKGKSRRGSGSSDSDSSSSTIFDDGSCETDDHCVDRLRRCVNNRCQCIPAYVDINGICTLLSSTGEPCNVNDQCKGEHVKCDNELNICLCEEGFLLTEKGKCVNCSTVDFKNYTIPCPGAKLCEECEDGLVRVGDECLLVSCTGEPCNDNDQCKGENVKCDNELNICLCEEGFLLTEKGKCVNCSTVDFRNYTIPCPGAKLCEECEDGLVRVGDECLLVSCTGEPCNVNDQCKGEHVKCDNELNICLCEEGFLLTEKGKCVNCSTVDFRNYTIPCPGAKLCEECEDGLVRVGDECLSLLCGKCTMDSDCFGDKEVCENNECVCNNDTYPDHCGVCQSKLPNNSECECGDQCESSTCLCGVCVPPDTSDCCNDCDEIKADLIFISDNSGSIGPAHYRQQMYFLITLINAFQISPNDSFVGWIDFSTSINTALNLNNRHFDNNLKVTGTLCKSPFLAGLTSMDLALQMAINFLNSAENRPGIPNIVVVMTDGISSQNEYPLVSLAVQLRSMPETKVVSVGIGSGVDMQGLQVIASSPDLVFLTEFTSPNALKNALLEAIYNCV